MRLRQDQLDALVEIAEQLKRSRNDLFVEAIDHWLLLQSRGLNAVDLVVALDTASDHELAEIENVLADALNKVNDARVRLMARGEVPKI
jgi:hypothetical protein